MGGIQNDSKVCKRLSSPTFLTRLGRWYKNWGGGREEEHSRPEIWLDALAMRSAVRIILKMVAFGKRCGHWQIMFNLTSSGTSSDIGRVWNDPLMIAKNAAVASSETTVRPHRQEQCFT